MTDNEIIKALGSCPYQRDCVSCDIDSCNNSPNYIMKCALDLIIRQKAEVERLQETIFMITKTGRFYSTVRAEAIKEFAERLCEDRISNDPVVIAVKTELKMMERNGG